MSEVYLSGADEDAADAKLWCDGCSGLLGSNKWIIAICQHMQDRQAPFLEERVCSCWQGPLHPASGFCDECSLS